MSTDTPTRELRTYRAWARAHQLAGGVRDAAFPPLVQQLMQSPLHQCPDAQLIVDGDQAFRAMLSAIDEARDEVLLETYILRDDRIGREVERALARAVTRGARVNVLADAVGSLETKSEFWAGLTRDGITVRLFHRLRYLPFQALRRDHRKIVVIDRTVAFTGGMNIGVEYGSSIRHHDAGAWRDTLVRLHGSVAEELAAVFAEGWDRADGPPLQGLEYISWDEQTLALRATREWSFRGQSLMTRVEQQLARVRPRTRGRRVRRRVDAGADTRTSTALVLDSRPGRGQREVLAVFASLIGGARQRLWITTPYFAPPSRALSLLRAASRRGVDVRLLVPGEKTDVPLARHAAHGVYRALLQSGVRVFEYQRATLHSKTLVVDGSAGVVGSTNIDFRSFWLNAECNVLLFDSAMAHDLETAFTNDCAQSIEITEAVWIQRTWWHAIGDWCARQLRVVL